MRNAFMRNKMCAFLPCLFIFAVCVEAGAAEKALPAGCAVTNGISYYSEAELAAGDDYQKTQCVLDVRYPTNKTGFATVVWFHGGGLTGGHRSFPDLKASDIAVVAVGYRLSPYGKLPSFLEDAAAATEWVIRNIGQYGGDSNKVFVSGHSAGGYLTAMIGMDPRWLGARGVSNMQLAGLIPVSAQVTTHFKVKKLRGDTGPEYRPLIDEYAPLYYSSKNLPPICLILGDRKIEYKNRVEENELLAASLRNLGHTNVEFYEMGGLDHGSVGEGGLIVARQFIRKTLKTMDAAAGQKKVTAVKCCR